MQKITQTGFSLSNFDNSVQAHFRLDELSLKIDEFKKLNTNKPENYQHEIDTFKKTASLHDPSYSVYEEFHIPQLSSRGPTFSQSEIVLDLRSPMKKWEDLGDFTALFRASRISHRTVHYEVSQETRIKFAKAPVDLVIRTNRLQHRTSEIKKVPEIFTLPDDLTDKLARYELTECHVLLPGTNALQVSTNKDEYKYCYSFHYTSIAKINALAPLTPPLPPLQPLSLQNLAWKASVATCGFLWRSFLGGIEYLMKNPKKTD